MDALAFVRLGVLINSALYLTGCFVAGVFFMQPVAWKFALITAAVAYLAYTAQETPEMPKIASGLVLLSIVTGSIAGLSLLFV